MKLGRLPAVQDPRTLRLAAYTARVPVPPREVHRSHREFAWPMYLNDQLGDCTVAAAAHLRQEWALENARPAPEATDQDIITAYSAVSGYDPQTGQGDNGAVELDVLKYWRATGIAGDRISAFASIPPLSATQIRQAIWLFGGAYIGVRLPITAQAQIGALWDVPAAGAQGPGAPGSWGGHAVPVVSYDATRLACITWGQVQLMTWRFFGVYVDEAYAVFDQELLTGGKSPQGFDAAALQTDLAAL